MSTADVESTSGDPTSAVDRRAKLHNTIASLIERRQRVATAYCALAGVSSLGARDVETLRPHTDQLSSFCQAMVDYTAMGHFEVYQRIIEGKERRQAVKDVAAEIYPAIAETTDYLLGFNDKYDDTEGKSIDTSLLVDDLPKLGDIIDLRGDLEDQILAALQK